ncbi:DUF6705 family protein [Chryseobacterium gleum]|uniref:DUF6705 family protein n=1 Tax=Chryseobacterium gleum TaxID=250 RepID=UPI001E4CCD22|nr:DUF6705 family protein [Chryseobacterium gleum]MCD9619032.1 hypothetical protein [Chryseobacterium gleum]
MKYIHLIAIFIFALSCKAQTYPLRTYIDLPKGAYLKDTNNELTAYEGVWKGGWESKTIYITFKKKTNIYMSKLLDYYADILIAKFKVIDTNGNILFDNTNLSDENAKITGGRFRKKDGKYSLGYVDNDICGLNGFIEINFTDSTKTKLEWKFNEGSNLITKDCPYYNSTAFPQPLPVSAILTKQ